MKTLPARRSGGAACCAARRRCISACCWLTKSSGGASAACGRRKKRRRITVVNGVPADGRRRMARRIGMARWRHRAKQIRQEGKASGAIIVGVRREHLLRRARRCDGAHRRAPAPAQRSAISGSGAAANRRRKRKAAGSSVIAPSALRAWRRYQARKCAWRAALASAWRGVKKRRNRHIGSGGRRGENGRWRQAAASA